MVRREPGSYGLYDETNVLVPFSNYDWKLVGTNINFGQHVQGSIIFLNYLFGQVAITAAAEIRVIELK